MATVRVPVTVVGVTVLQTGIGSGGDDHGDNYR